MADFGKMILGLGLLLVAVGAAILFADKLHIPIGRLPGDISWRSKSGNTSVYFPLGTCIVLSVVLSLVMWIVNSFRR